MKAFQVWMVAREPATLQELGRVMLRESDSRENCEVFNEALTVADKINLARSHFGRAVHARNPLYVVQTLPGQGVMAGLAGFMSLPHLRIAALTPSPGWPPTLPAADLVTPWKPGAPLGGVDTITVSGTTYVQVFCECEGTASTTKHPTRCGVCGRAFK